MYDIGRAVDAAVSVMLVGAALMGAAFVGIACAIAYICQHIYWEWI